MLNLLTLRTFITFSVLACPGLMALGLKSISDRASDVAPFHFVAKTEHSPSRDKPENIIQVAADEGSAQPRMPINVPSSIEPAAPPLEANQREPEETLPVQSQDIVGAQGEIRKVPIEFINEVARPKGLRRLEPLIEPLNAIEPWEEQIYSVTLNETLVSDGTLFLKATSDGALAIDFDALQTWRIRYEENLILNFEGLPFYPLDAITGSEFELDQSTLSIAITLPADAFLPLDIDLAEPEKMLPQSGTGAFLDYDLVAFQGETIEDRIDGLTEIGFFGRGFVGISNFRLDDITSQRNWSRLETSLFRDFPDKRATLRLGDSLTTGGTFAQPVRFAGFQWTSNFGTDPNFITFPLPSIGGLAESQAVVEVINDNVMRATQSVPPGPFRINNIPVVSGAGELQVSVRDLLGRERLVTQPYYVSSSLLKPGLHEFAYELGFLRQDFGEKSFDYGKPVASVTHRYGFNSYLTLEGHAEAEEDLVGAALGGTALLGRYGVLSFGSGTSLDHGEDQGYLGQLAYEYRTGNYNVGARTRFTSEEYRQLGGGITSARRTDQINLGVALGRYGRAGILAVNQQRDDARDTKNLVSTLSFPISSGALTLSGVTAIEPESEFALSAAFSMPLGLHRSAAAFAQWREEERSVRTQYTRTRGRSDLGLDYRVAVDVGDVSKSGDLRLDYRHLLAAANFEVEIDEEDVAFSAGARGSVSLVDGEIKLSRPLGRAFGLVNLPGFEGVKVYLDNIDAGTTDKNGKLLLPSLRPYLPNLIRVDEADLPLDANIKQSQTVAVPFASTGVTIDLDIENSTRAIAYFVNEAGEPLPAGLRLLSDDGSIEIIVARDGYGEVLGLNNSGGEAFGQDGNNVYRCLFPPDLIEENAIVSDIGEIRCSG